jgi:hypothetical protein
MSIRVDTTLLHTGGLASRLKGQSLQGARSWQSARAQTSPQIPEQTKTITTQRNDGIRAQREAPENFKINKVPAPPPSRLEKPIKIDIKV